MDTGTQPFSLRLQQVLEGVLPPRTQAWLAEESGIPASTISRLLRGERQPTPTVVESLAPVLGLEPALLVKGTDAEVRFQESGDWIRRANYEAAVRRLAEADLRANELEGRLKVAIDTLDRTKEALEKESRARCERERQLGDAHLQLERATRDLAEMRDQNGQLRGDLRRHQTALTAAVAEVATLRAKMSELADLLSKTTTSSRASAILAGVAAFTGAVTVAHFLSQDDRHDTATDMSKKRASKRRARKDRKE